MKEKTTTELPNTDYLRELANDDNVLIGNIYRDKARREKAKARREK